MNLTTEVFGDVVVVHTPEELGSEQVDGFGNFLRSLDRSNVIVDLDGTESIDSRGLEALVDAIDFLRAEGGDLKVTTTNPVNRKILEITRLDHQIEVHESVIDAVKSFL
jgi:anti-anti-sigma factor